MAVRPLSSLALLVLTACLTPGVDALAQPAARSAAQAGGAHEAIDAIREGDLRRARSILAELLVSEIVSAAERLVTAGRAIDSLVLLDEALELDPRDADLLYRRGSAAFEAAAGSSSPQYLYQDALQHFLDARSAGYGIQATFDASRAARRMPAPREALDLVRAGARELALLEERPALDPPLERTWAEASFDVYLEEVRAEGDATEYFAETELQLERLLGRVPDDPWPLLQLANLYQWEGRTLDSIDRVQRAVELSPEDQALHDRLLQLVPAEQGWPELNRFYETFVSAHPGSPRALRNRGTVAFYAALAQFDEAQEPEAYHTAADAFAAAETWFVSTRELDPSYGRECRGFEVVARNAAGWCHFRSGDMSAARQAFLSMEDVFEGGLAWSLPGRLPDGLTGLGFVVAQLTEDPNSVSTLEQMVQAAAITDYLHAYVPEDGNHANNAGFVNRDTAVLFQRKSLALLRAAALDEDPAARAALEAEAKRQLVRAQELMQRSWSAYQVAAELLRDDVRVINDAGLVMVYYLRDDPDEAERLFLRAVELGAQQLPESDLEEQDLYDLNEAWGDAHQNLAVLELTIRGRPLLAREWLVKALEIGPASREQVRPLLAVCERMIAGEAVDLSQTLAGNMVWLHNPSQ